MQCFTKRQPYNEQINRKEKRIMKKNNKGFTLAELLIVVAIIAVLVAIAIPIFTSQLEKAREATDIANIRDYYAEIAADLLTGDLDATNTTVTLSGGKTATYAASTGSYTVTVEDYDPQQGVSGWVTTGINVAGVTTLPSLVKGTSHDIVFTFTVPATGSAYLSEIK